MKTNEKHISIYVVNPDINKKWESERLTGPFDPLMESGRRQTSEMQQLASVLAKHGFQRLLDVDHDAKYFVSQMENHDLFIADKKRFNLKGNDIPHDNTINAIVVGYDYLRTFYRQSKDIDDTPLGKELQEINRHSMHEPFLMAHIKIRDGNKEAVEEVAKEVFQIASEHMDSKGKTHFIISEEIGKDLKYFSCVQDVMNSFKKDTRTRELDTKVSSKPKTNKLEK